MILTGIDLGSRFIKIVCFDTEKHNFIKKEIIDTVAFYKNFAKINNKKVSVDFEKLGIPYQKVCSTGYGRNNINLKNAIIINEIKAHYLGVLFQFKNLKNFTILDIGGQDTKVIKVKDGYIEDFVMNDKCAASTGRYLENMANILGVTIDYLYKQIKSPVTLNSTCAIFGESEVIGKIAEGKKISSICAGINLSLARRISPLLNKLYSETLILSGGVSKNFGIIHFLKKIVNFKKIVISTDAQFTGAIGCINNLLIEG